MVLRYNIAPGQDILFLCKPDDFNIKPLFLHWGFIPFWAKDKKIGTTLVNARSETAAEKPAFRNSFKSKRGIIVMSGFFEWQEDEQRQPLYFKQKDDDLLSIAALWDSWQSESGELIQSCCMLTTEPNQLMQPVHQRMPVILSIDELDTWMDNSHYDKTKLLSLTKPYPKKDLVCYPVTLKMNNARFNLPEAIAPIS